MRRAGSSAGRRRPTLVVCVLLVIGCGAALFVVLHPSGRSVLRHCVYTEQGPAGVAEFARLVGSPPIDCAGTFNESAADWQQWAHPFSASGEPAENDWPGWVRADPRRRLIIAQSLIPTSVEHGNWLVLGSEGAYARYATALARDLVDVGLGSSIIRLAPEANGTWETYSLPTSASGLSEWREFWRRTVLAMRVVPGAHFTFDWNVNALVRPIPLRSFYPGDDVVDVIGVDAYDPVSFRGGFEHLADAADGLRAVADFARAHGKPLSVPEWGVVADEPGVGSAYLRGLARFLRHTRTAYECYFFAHQFASALARRSPLRSLFEQEFATR